MQHPCGRNVLVPLNFKIPFHGTAKRGISNALFLFPFIVACNCVWASVSLQQIVSRDITEARLWLHLGKI